MAGKITDLTALAGSGVDTAADYMEIADTSVTTSKKILVSELAIALNGKVEVAQVVGTVTGAVSTGTTTIPLDDTIPQNTEGDQYMSQAITPTNASSVLLIDVVFFGASTAGDGGMMAAALFQDTTANALAAGWGRTDATGQPINIVFRHKMTAGTTSATTFKVRAGANGAGTTTFNGRAGGRIYGGVMASSITITEVLP